MPRFNAAPSPLRGAIRDFNGPPRLAMAKYGKSIGSSHVPRRKRSIDRGFWPSYIFPVLPPDVFQQLHLDHQFILSIGIGFILLVQLYARAPITQQIAKSPISHHDGLRSLWATT